MTKPADQAGTLERILLAIQRKVVRVFGTTFSLTGRSRVAAMTLVCPPPQFGKRRIVGVGVALQQLRPLIRRHVCGNEIRSRDVSSGSNRCLERLVVAEIVSGD
jgi:hypothetical protein